MLPVVRSIGIHSAQCAFRQSSRSFSSTTQHQNTAAIHGLFLVFAGATVANLLYTLDEVEKNKIKNKINKTEEGEERWILRHPRPWEDNFLTQDDLDFLKLDAFVATSRERTSMMQQQDEQQ